VESTGKSPKGFHIINIDSTEYNLFYFGSCIDKIHIGDSIYKLKDSYTLYLRSGGSETIITYNCME
jgi:hypothetical protein